MNFILKVLITGLIAYLLQNILSGVRIVDIKTAALFALVLALLNAVVKPILVILTIPVTVLTLGIFLLVINAFMVLLAANLFKGVYVDGFWWALAFSILLSIGSSILYSLVGGKKE
ncbi:phage holin family protein [Niabella ginsengisoli]|uniref:Phage holin family protein n=1 Tax=Niabella ginsengisoli TaxID=522298 RepID=A0ABS9SNE1_9BACT|nr:phage holin family protein [Niabella ginsengisoli]MCH5599860.1 phage holin family protein [Niabella ginsengisoli]